MQSVLREGNGIGALAQPDPDFPYFISSRLSNATKVIVPSSLIATKDEGSWLAEDTRAIGSMNRRSFLGEAEMLADPEAAEAERRRARDRAAYEELVKAQSLPLIEDDKDDEGYLQAVEGHATPVAKPLPIK